MNYQKYSNNIIKHSLIKKGCLSVLYDPFKSIMVYLMYNCMLQWGKRGGEICDLQYIIIKVIIDAFCTLELTVKNIGLTVNEEKK